MITTKELEMLKTMIGKMRPGPWQLEDASVEFTKACLLHLPSLIDRLEASEAALNGFLKLEQEKISYDDVCGLVSEWMDSKRKVGK